MNGFQRWCVGAVMLALGCSAWGREYFIASHAGSGEGTAQKPFGMADLPPAEDMYSEGRALSALAPGDTLTFLPGVYELHTSGKTVFGYIRPARSGEEGRPITIRAQKGGTVVLRSVSGSQGVLGTMKIRGWTGLDHVRFLGFVVECRLGFDKQANPELNGIRLAGKNNEVGWCTFSGRYLPTKNNFDGIRVENAVGARIHHNEIYGWKGDHWNSNGIKVYCSDGCIVEDNYIHDNHTGIFEKDAAAGNIYRRNYITNNQALAFLGSNQTRKGRADAWYSVYENVIRGPVNLLTLSRGVEFHDNLVFLKTGKGEDAEYAVAASGGRVFETKLWNNVVIGKREKLVAYGMNQTRWSGEGAERPLAYCDFNVYDGAPTYRFGRYGGKEDMFSAEQMRGMGFERNSRVVGGAGAVYEDETGYRLKPEWRKAGREGDAVGPDDVGMILDVTRYGAKAMPEAGKER